MRTRNVVSALKWTFAGAAVSALAACGGGGAQVVSPTKALSNLTLAGSASTSVPPPGATGSTPAGSWTWMAGDASTDGYGMYGTQGAAAAANTPGARYAPATWTDSGGNLWVYGGWGYDANDNLGFLNDLWMFSPYSRQWTWVSGAAGRGASAVYGTQDVADAGNTPGARAEASVVTDKAGNVWLLGGQGYGADGKWGVFADVWRYTPSTGLWTWVSGHNTTCQPGQTPSNAIVGVYGTKGVAAPGNMPGARGSESLWTDAAGDIWMFGGFGYGYSSQYFDELEDLWKFDPSTGLWTWVSGSDDVDVLATYGLQGVAAASNDPGARGSTSTWEDANGDLWMFGGIGGMHSGEYFADLWKYSPTSGQWTWMSGTTRGDIDGSYGTEGVAAASNLPAARSGAVSAIDSAGNFWLFGGYGNDGYANDDFADLWEFSPTTGQWTWVSGSNMSNTYGMYGTQGVAASGNFPGGRMAGGLWVDATGAVWMFGGQGYGATGSSGELNDVWVYRP